MPDTPLKLRIFRIIPNTGQVWFFTITDTSVENADNILQKTYLKRFRMPKYIGKQLRKSIWESWMNFLKNGKRCACVPDINRHTLRLMNLLTQSLH